MLNDSALFQALVVAIMAVAALIGWASTWRAYRRHMRIAPTMHGWIFLLSFSHVVIRVISSASASWFGYLSVRRLLDFEPLDWSPAVSWVFAVTVFFTPSFLDWVERKIADDESIPLPPDLKS